MRIATWNVNSLKARMEAVERWLERVRPDVVLLQETKLSDADAPVMPFGMLGYELVHHGEGRWNGVAILSRVGTSDVVTNFGDGPVRDSTAGASVAVSEDDFDPLDEARMVSAVCGGIRVVSLYAPNGRVVGSPFYEGKLRWFDRLSRWLTETCDPAEPLLLAGDYNVTPADADVWDPVAAHGGTHVSEPERAALARLRGWGLADTYRAVNAAPGRFSWWDYRAGMFHRNEGMRIDLLYATSSVASRVVWAEIDRQARKGPPTPSDHAPVVIDLDEPGHPFDPGWEGALERIAARTRPRRST
ncbi:MAG TPA: exodeoxyribonuclease III [Candidatus Sulfomarinibacteraceae bacterium]|nr:exodeoxyribonuclease III [Candidatus Sulfomarinibacteraceae bacterium]